MNKFTGIIILGVNRSAVSGLKEPCGRHVELIAELVVTGYVQLMATVIFGIERTSAVYNHARAVKLALRLVPSVTEPVGQGMMIMVRKPAISAAEKES